MAIVSERRFAEISDRASKLQKRLGNLRKDAERKATQGIRAAETIGAGFVTGYARGRLEDENGNMFIPGTRVQGDLAVGVGLSLLGFFEVAGGASDDLFALGVGTVAGYGAIAGQRVSKERKAAGKFLGEGARAGGTLVGKDPVAGRDIVGSEADILARLRRI